MIGLNDEIQTFKDPSSVTSGKIKSAVKKVFGIICMIRSLKSILFMRKI